MRITLVTGNPHKLRELTAIAPPEFTFVSRALDIDEIQSLDLRKIVEDKVHKAYEQLQSPVIVEDVAAELESLHGLPGPFIKFFEQQLGRGALYKLSKQPNDRITIRCIAAYYDGQQPLLGEGTIQGHITAPRGEHGFGFDCVTVVDGETRTVAEMSEAEKNAISHRGQAFRALLEHIAAHANNSLGMRRKK